MRIFGSTISSKTPDILSFIVHHKTTPWPKPISAVLCVKTLVSTTWLTPARCKVYHMMMLTLPSLLLSIFLFSSLIQAVLKLFCDERNELYKNYFPPQMSSDHTEPPDMDWVKRTFHLDTWARRSALATANRLENETLRPLVYHAERAKILDAIWPSANIFPVSTFTDLIPLDNDSDKFYHIKSRYAFVNGMGTCPSFSRQMFSWRNIVGHQRKAWAVLRSQLGCTLSAWARRWI